MGFYFYTYLPTEIKFTIFISTRLEHCEMATKMLFYIFDIENLAQGKLKETTL